jgi:homoserine dehydrogenase
MPRKPLIVLKFGGSVLVNPDRLRLAVHEIYRWRRKGFGVVAVVSALAGKTDELLSICQACSPGASPGAVAFTLALGESESAALLGVQLDRVGLPHRVLTPAAIGLIGEGDPLDAHPIEVDRARLSEALQDPGTVVIPGFVAVDRLGNHVTLGRGGSDLTALFLAHALAADRCRLVKDVDGLYTQDPATSPTPPRRYARCAYEDAFLTDGSIIQHKATRFAHKHGVEFEVGRLGGSAPTVVGQGTSVTNDHRDLPRKLRVAIAGVGTVGGGVLELLGQLPECFEVSALCCRNEQTRQELTDQGYRVETDLLALPRHADVVVELIGGVTDARKLIEQSLHTGCHVVTANKALLAEAGDLLRDVAHANGCQLLGSASVGGGLPVLEHAACDAVRSIRGVLNGTANFILERTRLGIPFADALSEAQTKGLAEADPTRDLDGSDSLDKLRVLAQAIGVAVNADNAIKKPITPASVRRPDGILTHLRHVASLDEAGLRVELEAVGADDPLFDLPGEMNAVTIEYQDGSKQTLRGLGAGRWPTAESVIADLLRISRIESLQKVVEHV